MNALSVTLELSAVGVHALLSAVLTRVVTLAGLVCARVACTGGRAGESCRFAIVGGVVLFFKCAIC